MVIDHQLNPGKYTKEQLRQNASEAEAAARVAYAAVRVADKDAFAYASAAASVADVADYAADVAATYDTAYAAATGRLIDRYFKRSGEDRQDYIDEINKENNNEQKLTNGH